MNRRFVAELVKPKMYCLSLHTLDGNRVAEIDITLHQFMPILRKFNMGYLHAFTLFVLRELQMSQRNPDKYYVVVLPKPESWIPYRYGLSDARSGKRG
ncbi:MAG: hypothetical protein JWQ98_1331 [Chlorobi bacterium]|nr:hypothetical protein [Chlorobiota bacterium]